MTIDIYNYWNRWLINYIVYHKEHLIEYGDVDSANTHFSVQYQEAISKMNSSSEEAYISSIQEQMQSQGQAAAKGIKILSDIQVGTLLDSTLDEIVKGINEGIDLAGEQVNFDNYNSILQEARGFNNLLANKNPNAQRVNQFFNLLLQGLDQAKMIDINILNALSQIGNQLVGTSFQIDPVWQNKAVALSDVDIQTAQKVIDSLNRAVQRLGREGTVSSRSFANTISYIFNQTIGNKIGQMIIAEGIKMGLDTVDSILDKAVNQSGGKLIWVDKGETTSSFDGETIVFDQDAFNLKVQKKGQTFNIEIGTGANIKWDNRRKSNNVIQAIAKTTIGDYFADMREKYLAYNIIAHRFTGPEFENTFNLIRASTAASFFNNWVQSGGFKVPNGQPAQFLLVNGKVYSVQRIINNICDDIMRNGGQGAFSLNIASGQINKWQGQSASLVDAIKRSNMVNQIIDKFTIAATLNSNILTKYAY